MEKNIFCELDGKWYNKHGIVLRIKSFGFHDPKVYYDQFLKKDGDGVCKFCGDNTKFRKFRYYEFCNVSCSAKYHKNSKKVWDNASLSEKERMIKKALNTRIDNGTTHIDKSVQEKRANTLLANTGMTLREYSRKRWNERMEKLTDEQKIEFYDNATRKRNNYRYTMYELNGVLTRTQGYEPYVLDVLKKIYSEDTIKVDQNIIIRYMCDGRKRRYYPDIIVGNILFEVKSWYTLSLRPKEALLKLKAAKDAGYIPVLVLWDKKQAEMCEKDLIETISSQALSHEGRFNDYPFIGVGNKQMISEALDNCKVDDIVCSSMRIEAAKAV